MASRHGKRPTAYGLRLAQQSSSAAKRSKNLFPKMNDLPPIESVDTESIRARILTVRSVQVMLDRDLAELYGVPTKALNQAVKRNPDRFPSEFVFVLTPEEMVELVTNCDRFSKMKHSSVPMRAFTEHGVIMLASVLRSNMATEVSVRITRAFVAMRRALASMAPIPRQKVFCLLVAGQVKHPGHFGKDLMTSRNTRKAERRPDGRRSAFRP